MGIVGSSHTERLLYTDMGRLASLLLKSRVLRAYHVSGGTLWFWAVVVSSWDCSGPSVLLTAAWPLAGDAGDRRCGDQCGGPVLTGGVPRWLGQETSGSRREAHLVLGG
jgi:hypothetical protein